MTEDKNKKTANVFSKKPEKLVSPEEIGFILHEKARIYYWEGSGLLSVKSFSGGHALYDTGKGLHRVDEDCFLILNHDQPYSITIEAAREVESFCLFFAPSLVESVYYSLAAKTDELLDNPVPPSKFQIDFYDKTYRHEQVLSPALAALKSRYAALSQTSQPPTLLELEEQMHDIAEQLFDVHRSTRIKAMRRMRAVRPATRDEIYRRVARAGDFIAASYDEPLTLRQMASVACLSPNHFLRSFRQAFGVSPHQFLISERLRRAEKMLRETNRSITEISLRIGFESVSSFSRLFRQRFKTSPKEFRRAKR